MFKKYIVEFASKRIKDPNVKINVGARNKEQAIEFALKRKEAVEFKRGDVVRTCCPSLKQPTGKTLSTFSAR